MTALQKMEFVYLLRNKTTARIFANNLEEAENAWKNTTMIRVSPTRTINTVEIIDCMSVAEYEEHKKEQQGWYVRGLYWYTGKGERVEPTAQAIKDKARLEQEITKMKNAGEYLADNPKAVALQKEYLVYAKL